MSDDVDKNAKKDGDGSIKYFDLSEALDDVSNSPEAKDTAVASAKLFGKALFNVGLFAAKAGVEIAKELPHTTAKQAEKILDSGKELTDEQRGKLQRAVDVSKELREKDKKKENKTS